MGRNDCSNYHGFRKIVTDRWEFANEFFKKGEEHLLCEIHRRKTIPPHHHQLQVPVINGTTTNCGGGGGGSLGFFRFPGRVINSISSSDSEEQQNQMCDPSSPLSSPGCNSSLSALSEDNERLRLSNSMLMSELSHMKKLYSDVVYFLQNHVKHGGGGGGGAPPSYHHDRSLSSPSSTSLSLLFGNNNPSTTCKAPKSHLQFLNQYLSKEDYLDDSTKKRPNMDENRTKLFGVLLHDDQSRKRLNVNSTEEPTSMETKKFRLAVLSKEDLGLKLMPLSPF